jgi:hypothetical protein
MLIDYHGFMSLSSHACRHPTKLLQKYMVKVSSFNLSVMLSFHFICTHLGGADHI